MICLFINKTFSRKCFELTKIVVRGLTPAEVIPAYPSEPNKP
jgi:hypothetical protein